MVVHKALQLQIQKSREQEIRVSCSDTPQMRLLELMPLPIIMAHKLTRKLAEVRKSGEIGWIRPDGKSQVSVQYKDGRPESIIAIVVSTQHAPNITSDEIEKTITEKVIKPVCGKWWNDEIKIFVNPTGKFEIGGPHGDAGLTGRKIIVEHTGVLGARWRCFFWQTSLKVDRSSATCAGICCPL